MVYSANKVETIRIVEVQVPVEVIREVKVPVELIHEVEKIVKEPIKRLIIKKVPFSGRVCIPSSDASYTATCHIAIKDNQFSHFIIGINDDNNGTIDHTVTSFTFN